MKRGLRIDTRVQALQPVTGLLGDTAGRDYAHKLQLFNAFAEPELRRAIATVKLEPGMRILDAGCGTGEALPWLTQAAAPAGWVIGLDLAAAHLKSARARIGAGTALLQADLARAPLAQGSFDLIWSVNTINHLREPLQGVQALAALLRSGGRIAVGQSSLQPDMYFAWDARLERLTNDAVRRYYRDRYGLDERTLTDIRALVGLLRRAKLQNVTVRTFVIERAAPLSAADEAYLLEGIFRGTWGERLRPYMCADDFNELALLCDPRHPRFALRRPDFHFLQGFTLAVAGIQ